MRILEEHINEEIAAADKLIGSRDLHSAFDHLERAHVLGQANTYQHTRVHWRMLKVGLRMGSVREIWGQIIRIIGAATKTPFGIYPKGNTGGSNVYFFKPMPVPEDLQRIIDKAKMN
ncbi:MAG: DUF3703 domain-containing protein [Acidobacteriota bacterium]